MSNFTIITAAQALVASEKSKREKADEKLAQIAEMIDDAIKDGNTHIRHRMFKFGSDLIVRDVLLKLGYYITEDQISWSGTEQL